MNKKMANEIINVIQTDDGELIWYNPETKTYQFVTETDDSRTLEATISTSATTAASPAPTPSSNQKVGWNKKETLMLLTLCQQKRDDLENTKMRKSDFYKNIASAMKTNGYSFTSEQCNNRMKTLTARYKEIKDHNNRTGEARKDWDYYENMETFLGERVTVTPEASCSTTLNYSSSSSSSEQNEPPKKKQKIHHTPRSEMLKWLESSKIDADEKEARRLEMLERHHVENSKLLQALIDKLN